jgi:hypothetical protein
VVSRRASTFDAAKLRPDPSLFDQMLENGASLRVSSVSPHLKEKYMAILWYTSHWRATDVPETDKEDRRLLARFCGHDGKVTEQDRSTLKHPTSARAQLLHTNSFTA